MRMFLDSKLCFKIVTCLSSPEEIRKCCPVFQNSTSMVYTFDLRKKYRASI